MAQYWDAFAGSTLGNAPTGWTPRLVTTGVTYVVEADPDGPAGRRLRITRASGTGRSLISLDAIDADPDRATIKIRVLMRINADGSTTQTTYAGPATRASGTSASQTLYIGSFGRSAAGTNDRWFRLLEYVAGTSDQLAVTATNAWEVGELYWVELESDGSNQQMRVYAAADPGTALFDFGAVDTSIAAAGWAGIFSFTSAASPFDILAVGIGTNGDDAPMSDPADTTAPTLTSASGTATGTTTADGSVTTDEGNGTLYAVASTSSTAPSSTQIKAGQDNSGSAAPYATSQAVAGTGAQAVAATGLTASTAYYWHFLHRDAAGNDSAVATSASFTTDAVAVVVKGVSLTLHDASTAQASLTGITALWWDASAPTGAPAFEATTAATDATGVLELDLDASTALDVTDVGFLMLHKAGATAEDDLIFAGRLAVQDIG